MHLLWFRDCKIADTSHLRIVDIVDKISDLISDLFNVDDSYIADTSAASIAARSPGSSSDSFFRSTATSSNNLPLLRTEMLKKFIRQFGVVRTKRKADEFFSEVEEGGISRLLKILERSWKGTEELSYWSRDALAAKVETAAAAGTGATKKKAATKKVKKTSSPVGKQSRKKKTTFLGDSEEDGEEERDEAGDEEQDGREYRPGARGSSKGPTRASTRSRSRTPALASGTEEHEEDVDVDVDMEDGSIWTESALQDFSLSLQSLSDALISIRAALSLLTLLRLPKQLYSADLVSSILASLRHTLDSFLIPLLEASLGSHLDDVAQIYASDVRSICDEVEMVMPLLSRLVRQEETNEEIVTSMIYCSLSPFFHEASGTIAFGGGVSGKGGRSDLKLNVVEKSMKGIRMASLGLVRSVYAKYADQRAWIIEEVLSNMTRLEVAKKGRGTLR